MSLGSSGRLAAVLVLSLAINLFLGGMMFSGWLIHRHDPAAGPLRIPFSLAAVDETGNAEASAIRARHAAGIRQNFRELRTARREIHRLLVAEEFDAAAFDAALADLRGRSEIAQTAVHAALGEIAAILTLEQRRRLAEATMRKHPLPRRRPPPGD
jgi:uncharacterized membrane protein